VELVEQPTEGLLTAAKLPSALRCLEHRLLDSRDMVEVSLPLPFTAAHLLHPDTPLHSYCVCDLGLHLSVYPLSSIMIRLELVGPIPYVDAAVKAVNLSLESISGQPRPNLVEFDMYPEAVPGLCESAKFGTTMTLFSCGMILIVIFTAMFSHFGTPPSDASSPECSKWMC
jgi:hypothetical protein